MKAGSRWIRPQWSSEGAHWSWLDERDNRGFAEFSATSSAPRRCGACGRTRTGRQSISRSKERSRSCRAARHHSEGGSRRDRAQLRHRQDRHGQAAGADRAHRLSHPRRRLAAERAVHGTSSASTATGGRRHRTSPTRRRCCRFVRRSRFVDSELEAISAALAALPPLSRHAGGRQEQSAAGDPGDVRLQDGDDPRRGGASPRAARAIAAPRAGRGVRRRMRHAGVDRARRHGNAGRPHGGARVGTAVDRLAYGARHHRRGRRLPRARRRARSARCRWTSSS